MPKVLVEFTKGGFTIDPQVVRLDTEATVSDELRISFITCRSLEKDAVLLQILKAIQEDTKIHESTRTGLTLVFCATRHHVEYVTTLLQASGQKATLIYGTLDSEARQANLSAFRNGTKPILVVTDVAARGIDIPFMDHVIHYHFPPSPKLFVHRSGRCSRAGRIGYCWSLVEPDELPYMVDLHLFLGRKLTSSKGKFVEEDGEGKSEPIELYTLDDMTPEMVHYGSVPESIMNFEVENVRRIMDSEMAGSEVSESMRALSKCSTNAMKQYRKTRPEASRAGVRRAKAILEGQKMKTGQRVGGTAIPPHPLLEGLVMARYEEDKETGKIGTLNDLGNIKKRQDFLEALAQFRPKETVFEAFATGGRKDGGVVSQVDKGRTSNMSKKTDSSFALTAMKHMRRQMKMARDKGTSLVVAGSTICLEQNELDDAEIGPQVADKAGGAKDSFVETLSGSRVTTAVPEAKRRMSKAERSRQKKKGVNAIPASTTSEEKRKKNVRGNDFRDPAFFMENDAVSNSEEAQRRRQVEAAMQPSAAFSQKGAVGTALRIEDAMLDIVGDENDELVQKQRMMRWDKSKRKYMQTTVGQELSGDSKSKKMKLESGQIVKTDKMIHGEAYTKWQKRTNRSVGRDGVFDNPTNDVDDQEITAPTGRRGGKASKKGYGAEKQISAKAIKVDRDSKQDMKMKNMKKDDRRRLERSKDGQGSEKGMPKKGHQGKKGSSGRWKK
jgi:ATP-dependent RNA helicase DDX54/DBP10